MPQRRGAAAAAAALCCAAPRRATAREISVADFGAVPDNATDATAAFRAATAAAAPGDIVVVPAGGWYATAPFNLTSGVTLRVEAGAVVRGVADQAAYPAVAPMPSYGGSRDVGRLRHHPLVWAVGAAGVRITGGGVIDGSGPYWWGLFKQNHSRGLTAGRPHLVEFLNCTDVEVGGVTLRNSGFWTLHPLYSRGVWVHDVTVRAPWGSPNTDGIDPDSSSDVLIERCDIACGDDHVAIKSGKDAAGLSFGMPSRNVTVRDCVLGHGMGVSIGSEVSGGVEDVLVANVTMNESRTEWGNGFLIKTAPTRGAYVRRVTYADCVLGNVTDIAMQIRTNYDGGRPPPGGPTEIRDIAYRNLTVLYARGAGAWRCDERRPCVNVTVQNVTVSGAQPHWNCANVSGAVAGASPPGLPACFANSTRPRR